MKDFNHSGLGLLLLLVATSGADEQPATPTSVRFVHLKDCKITLIDHVTLASDRSGIIKLVEFKEGDAVSAGTQVVLIDDRVAKANLDVAEKKATNEVEIRYAEVAFEAAKKELEMMEKSNEALNALPSNKSKVDAGSKAKAETKIEHAFAVAPSEIEKSRLAKEKAELSIEQAKHELQLNKLNYVVTKAELDTYSVNAEFDGVVVKVFKKKGEAVRQGDPVAEIVNTDRVRIKGRVSLADLPFAQRGAKVLVRLYVENLDLPEEDEVFEGRITFVDLVSNEIDQTTIVHAEVQNRNNILRAGLDALVDIEVDEETAAKRERAANERVVEKKVLSAGGR